MEEIISFIVKYIALPFLSATIALTFNSTIQYLKQDFNAKVKQEMEILERRLQLSERLKINQDKSNITKNQEILLSHNEDSIKQDSFKLLLIDSIGVQSPSAKLALVKNSYHKDEFITKPDRLPEMVKIFAALITTLSFYISLIVVVAWNKMPSNLNFIVYLLIGLTAALAALSPLYALSEYYRHGIIFKNSYKYVYEQINGNGHSGFKKANSRTDTIFYKSKRVPKEKRYTYGFTPLEDATSTTQDYSI